MGPLRARKAADIKESVQIGDAIQRGEVWQGDGRLQVQARSLILPSDDMTMVVNSSTYLPTRIDFNTQYEGSPVAIAVDYEQLPNGPSMMTRMTVQTPNESIVVNVQAFDFVRLAGPSTL
jgi:hypothetical protein